MNSDQFDHGLSAMLEGSNFPIEPGALLQQPLDTDTASSRTTSSSSVPRLATPDTEHEDEEDFVDEDDEDLTPKKPNTRARNGKMPTKTKTATTSTSPAKTTKAASKKATSRATPGKTGVAEKRRKRNLERNRAAASKCRQRKKQWQDGLERRKTDLESRYKALHRESKDLMEEVAQLKNLVMAHAGCNDANIDDWIRSEADSFVRRMSTHQAAAQQVQQAQQAQQQQQIEQQVQQQVQQQQADAAAGMAAQAQGTMPQTNPSPTQVPTTAPPLNGEFHLYTHPIREYC